MTEKFVTAAELMAQVLGADGHEFVVIPHPISSAKPEALTIIGRQAADECVALLTQQK